MANIEQFNTEEIRDMLSYIRKKYLPEEDDTHIHQLNRDGLLLLQKAMYSDTSEERENTYSQASQNLHQSLKKIQSMALDVRKFQLIVKEKQENHDNDDHLMQLEHDLENI